jgi:hypothetical protein
MINNESVSHLGQSHWQSLPMSLAGVADVQVYLWFTFGLGDREKAQLSSPAQLKPNPGQSQTGQLSCLGFQHSSKHWGSSAIERRASKGMNSWWSVSCGKYVSRGEWSSVQQAACQYNMQKEHCVVFSPSVKVWVSKHLTQDLALAPERSGRHIRTKTASWASWRVECGWIREREPLSWRGNQKHKHNSNQNDHQKPRNLVSQNPSLTKMKLIHFCPVT